jgi:5-methyltetrahydrofolate corrinoid/iron sulfur protein methyltransferase
MSKGIIGIAESLHASIPKHAKPMKELLDMGADAYTQPSDALTAIKDLIESQADDGAAFIAINVDAFGEADPKIAVDLMVEYTRLVRQWGKGVPACIDSSDDAVLIAGLKEWYNTDEDVKQPLVNSIKVYSADKMLPLKKEYDFAIVGLLMGEEAPRGPGGAHSVDELYAFAKEIFDKAMEFGFKHGEIYYDATAFPLAIDMPMTPGVPSFTYAAFETIKKIDTDADMHGVHFSMGISNSCRDLPARKVGICRAYVEVAMRYGLDAGIVNVAHHFGESPADPVLVELVEAFAKMDGKMETMNDAMMLMGQFCASAKK